MLKRNRKIKIVIGKAGIDGHWRGIQYIAIALKNAGIEVVYAGSLTADALLETAIQEDADIIGVHVGASTKQIENLIKNMKKRQIEDVKVIIGGTIPLPDIPRLKELGVGAVFPPGSNVGDIIKYIQENARIMESAAK